MVEATHGLEIALTFLDIAWTSAAVMWKGAESSLLNHGSSVA